MTRLNGGIIGKTNKENTMDLLLLSQFFLYMTGINILIYFLLLIIHRNLGKKSFLLELISIRLIGRYKLYIIVFNLVPYVALSMLL